MLLQSGHLKYCNALQSSAVWEEFITLFNTTSFSLCQLAHQYRLQISCTKCRQKSCKAAEAIPRNPADSARALPPAFKFTLV